MSKPIKVIITVCVVATLAFYIRATDFAKVVASIQQVGYWFGLLILITLVAYVFATVAWQLCLGEKAGSISLLNLFLVRIAGETIGLINPASVVGGDAMKVLLLRNYDIEERTVIVSVLTSRAIMIVTQLLAFTSVLVILLSGGVSIHIINLSQNNIIFLLAIAGAVLLVFIFKKQLSHWFYGTRAGLYLKKSTLPLRLKIKEIIIELNFLWLHHKKLLLLSCILTLMHWITGSLEFYFILKLLGFKASVAQALLVDMGVIFFKTAGAFIPGQLGVEEYGNKIMLAIIGITDADLWITASILRRARQLFWVIFGIGVYFVLNKRQAATLQST